MQEVSRRSGDCLDWLAVGFLTAHALPGTLAERWNGSTSTIVKTPRGP